MQKSLPVIPAKRYFTIGEVADLCGVKTHVLRYWEQEFTQLRPMKRKGNRRYYQHHEVLMIRRIRELLYEQGFTIVGARNKMQELMQAERQARGVNPSMLEGIEVVEWMDEAPPTDDMPAASAGAGTEPDGNSLYLVRKELIEIRELLQAGF